MAAQTLRLTFFFSLPQGKDNSKEKPQKMQYIYGEKAKTM